MIFIAITITLISRILETLPVNTIIFIQNENENVIHYETEGAISSIMFLPLEKPSILIESFGSS